MNAEPVRRRTLFWRLGVALVAVQVTVTIGLSAYAWAQIRSSHYERAAVWLEGLCRLATDLISEQSTLDAIRAEAARIAELGAVRVTVIDADGLVLADTHEDPAAMAKHRHRPEIDDALAHGLGRSHRYSGTLRERLLYAAVRVPTEPGTRPLVVRTAVSTTTLNTQLATTLRAILVAAAISLALTVGVITLVASALGRQVSALADAARGFARGHLAQRVSAPEIRELGSLANALNDMAAQLDQKLSELQKQRGEQQAILRSMSSGMIALDLDQRVLSINRAAEQMLQTDGASARGRLLLDVIREPSLAAFVERALGADEPMQAALDLETGKRAALEVGSEPLLNAEGVQTGLLLLLDDVTRLRRLERVRSDFAANVSHELRTPITTIRGYIETLLEVGCDDQAQTEHFLSAAHRSTIRLGAIIEDLLALARLEQAGIKSKAADAEVVSLESVVAGAVRDHAPAAAERGITVQTSTAPGLRVRGAHQLLEQALGNLLANAIVYSPSGTTVRVETTRDQTSPESWVRLTVHDEGPGIAAEHLPRLFERFYRVDKARSRASGGTGLGLAIVKHICLAHGGRPEVESQVGAGSAFHIVLPSI